MQIVRSLAIIALAVGLAGCGAASPAASPGGPIGSAPTPAATTDASESAASGDTTAAEIDQILAQALSQPIDLSDPGPALNRAEQDMKDFMRQAAGVADLLGPGGEAIFAEIDDAEHQMIADMVAELRAQALTPGARPLAMDGARPDSPLISARLASVLIPGSSGGTDPYAEEEGGASLFGVFMFTSMGPEMFAKAPRGASGNLERQARTDKKTFSDGSTVSLTMTPSLAGSKMNAEVKVEISVPGPPAYTEEATGALTVGLCPDAYGNVPLEMSIGGGFSRLGGGMQYKVTVAATGHVDDSGELVGTDMQVLGSLGSQPQKGQEALGGAPMYIEVSYGYSDGPAGSSTVPAETRYSSRIDEAFVRRAVGMIPFMGTGPSYLALKSAEKLWTTGYCLEISVPSMDAGNSKSVATGSTTPFTANVRHKFEGTDLAVPVTATLGSGGVSVSPSGSKVPAPATFQYKAPDQDRQTATVNLETRSKRGIATLAVTFSTASPGWIFGGPEGAVVGKKCGGPGGDWVEEMAVASLGMTQKWVITIDEATLKGTYTMDAVQQLKGASGIWHGTGKASLAIQADGSASISFTGGTSTITAKTSGGTSTQSMPGPEGQHSVWLPAGDACR